MSKRRKSKSEENISSEAEPEQVEDMQVEVMRTRSGRRIRTPSALLESQTPKKTPSRRTRRSILQELPPEEEPNGVEETPKSPVEESTETTEPVMVEALTETQENLSRPEAETIPESSEIIPEKKPRPAQIVKQMPVIPLGKPKSGRVWKDRNKQRFSSLVRDKPLCTSWEKKMEAKRENQLVKQFSKRLKDEKAQKKAEKRKRQEESQRRRAENERKAEVVQVICNTTKIKRMKKKLLRKIEKRDTLAAVQKSQRQNAKTKTQKNIKQDLT